MAYKFLLSIIFIVNSYGIIECNYASIQDISNITNASIFK